MLKVQGRNHLKPCHMGTPALGERGCGLCEHHEPRNPGWGLNQESGRRAKPLAPCEWSLWVASPLSFIHGRGEGVKPDAEVCGVQVSLLKLSSNGQGDNPRVAGASVFHQCCGAGAGARVASASTVTPCGPESKKS